MLRYRKKISAKYKICASYYLQFGDADADMAVAMDTLEEVCTAQQFAHQRLRIHDTGELTIVAFFITGNIIYNAKRVIPTWMDYAY